MPRPLTWALSALLAFSILAVVPNEPGALPADDVVTLEADFRYSGSFVPGPMDTNQDGLPAEIVTAVVNGRLEGSAGGTVLNTGLASYSLTVECGLMSPSDACTSCFRVNEGEYSVQEHAYLGPIANLIRPIRNPNRNPTSAAFGAEEWTGHYTLKTGELLYAQTTDLQICVEQADPEESPVPICHVKQSEIIVGGTGRFKHATGTVTYAAIAPTYTSDAPLLAEDGCMDLGAPPPSFATGPIHGAGHMSLHVPIADLK